MTAICEWVPAVEKDVDRQQSSWETWIELQKKHQLFRLNCYGAAALMSDGYDIDRVRGGPYVIENIRLEKMEGGFVWAEIDFKVVIRVEDVEADPSLKVISSYGRGPWTTARIMLRAQPLSLMLYVNLWDERRDREEADKFIGALSVPLPAPDNKSLEPF